MRAPVLVLGFIFAWAAAITGCGDNDGGGTNKPLGSEKELTAFSFSTADNAALTADVTATITGDSIAATLPFGTDLTALVATFDTTGASVAINGAAQVSGTTKNDFSRILAYQVTAEDGSTRTYNVSVTAAPSNANAITAFAFTTAKNAALAADVVATINGTTIAATVPFGTNVTALVATYTSTGTIVKIGGVAQTSDVTANTFVSPVSYAVTAADGTTATYTVTVTVAASAAKELTAYSFKTVGNGLPAEVVGTISGTTITATVPFGTDVTALIATFTTTGISVKVGGTAQVSGTTPNNFTSPVTYTVTAADGTTKDYTVAITIAANPAKALTAFSFTSAKNAGLTADVTATLDQTAHTIAATVPFGTDVTALVATFASTGPSVKVGTTEQVSGTTPNSFATPVTYLVTAADGSTQPYVATVTVAQNDAKAISAFSFLSASNAGLSANIVATIDEGNKTITAAVPFGTSLTALVATYTASGLSVTVGGATQVSGITANDFTAPVDYVVHAADGTTVTYTVTLTITLSSEKALTAFGFTVTDNPTLTSDAVVTITGTDIAAVLPFGTPAATIKTLIGRFTSTGNTVTVGGVAQISGTTPNDFSSPVAYLVTAQDNSTATYTVTVTIAKNPAKAITAYSFVVTDTVNIDVKITAVGAIDESNHTITLEIPPGINVKALVATFTAPAVTSVQVGTTAQVSGTTQNDFTNPVTYIVTAEDGTTQSYVVTAKPYVAQFSFTGSTGTPATYPSDGLNLNLVAQPVMARSGGTATSANNAFGGSGWITAAIDLNHWFGFSVQPIAGKTLTLTKLSLRDQRSSATGPVTYAIRTSIDNFATDVATVAVHGSLGTPPTVTVFDPAVFSNLTAKVDIRIYGYGGTVTGSTWRIDEVLLSGTVQ